MPKRTSKHTDFSVLYSGGYRYEFYGVSKICFSILRKDFNSCFPQDYKSSGAGGGHATVTTTNNKNLTEWAKSKNNLLEGMLGQLKAHYLTKKVASARVGEQKVSKP